MTVEEGKKAPNFNLIGSNGSKHKLADYKGKWVVLYFYPKDDTPGCTKQACGFRDLKKQYEKLDVEIIGVSPDETHDAFISKYKLPFTLLSDPKKKVMEVYGAWGEKNMYGKKTIGVIRSTTIIDPQQKVAKHYKRVPKAEAHPEKVLEWIAGQ